MLEVVVGILHQMDPTLLPRIDPALFLSSISGVVDGVRVSAPAWDLAPGWHGEDVRIGKDYRELLRSSFDVDTIQELAESRPEALPSLWNSDKFETEFPFNRPQLAEARKGWNNHVERRKASIPVSVRFEKPKGYDGVVLGGRLGGQRKAAMKTAPKPKAKARAVEEPPKKKTRTIQDDQGEC